MRRDWFILTVMLWAMVGVPAIAAAVEPVAPVSDAELTDAIRRIQQHLLSLQDPATGSWDHRYAGGGTHRGGETALVMFALLRSGVSVQDARMRAAAEYLEKVRMNGTYAISLRAHCWAALSDDYRQRLAADARWLIRAQADGLFDYGPRTGPRYDHSVTQYGLLGLWESAKRRGPSAGRVWQQSAQHFIETQNPDGGWGYQSGASTATMTAAGLTALLIAQENLYRSRNTPPDRITLAINGAVAWLDHYTSANGVNANNNLYYLVSLERAALASGIKTLGGQDWFQAGARLILDHEHATGALGERSDTAFALLFLSRGTVPVWINKLRMAGQAWNNRPNDLNMLTRELSEVVEAELNWQVIDADGDVSHWLDAPVAYVASDEPVVFSAAALGNLKTYLDLGGVLVATPDGDPQAFGESVRRIASQLYPHLQFERVGPGHALMGLVFEVQLPEEQRPWVLSNGVRDLIILSPADWGMALQSSLDAHGTAARDIMANLNALATDRAGGEARRRAPLTPRLAGTSHGTLPVLRVTRGGAEPLEPLAWRPMQERFFNRTGYELDIHARPAEQVGDVDARLVHLGGVGAQRLSPAELRALTDHINQGGTVLIETIGGRGDHTAEVLRQFEAVLGQQAVPMAADHPIVTGVGLSAGYDQRRVSYRRYSSLNRGPVESLRLMTLDLDGRSAVIASHEDISLGVLGVTHWGIDGYEIDDARQLLTNILLYAQRDTADKTTPAAQSPAGVLTIQPDDE